MSASLIRRLLRSSPYGLPTADLSSAVNEFAASRKWGSSDRRQNTFEGFAGMIYLITGKLELAVPNPF